MTTPTLTSHINTLSSWWNDASLQWQSAAVDRIANLRAGRTLSLDISLPSSLADSTVTVPSPITSLDIRSNELVVAEEEADKVSVYTFQDNHWSLLGPPIIPFEKDLCEGDSDVSLAGNHHQLAISCPLHSFVHLYEFNDNQNEGVWTLRQSLDAPQADHPGQSIQYSRDGAKLAVSTHDNTGVHIIDLQKGTDASSPLSFGAKTISVSKDAGFLLEDDGNSIARVYSRTPQGHWKELGNGIFDLAFSSSITVMDIEVLEGLRHLPEPIPTVVLGTQLQMEGFHSTTELRAYVYNIHHDEWLPMGGEIALDDEKVVKAELIGTLRQRLAVVSKINDHRCRLQLFVFGDDDDWFSELDYKYKGDDCTLLAVSSNEVAIGEKVSMTAYRVRVFSVLEETEPSTPATRPAS